MPSDASSSGATPASDLDFSLMLGGPLFQLCLRAHISDNALALTHRRILAAVAITWAPLLVICALQGSLFGGGQSVPFLKDVDCHLRFLVSVPLLIFAELFVHRRMRPIVDQFRIRELVRPDQWELFNKALHQTFRLRNSIVAEALLVVFVYSVGVAFVWRQYAALGTGTWYAATDAGGYRLSLAGLWFALVSLPIYQFLLCRWYFRLFVWAVFLWRVAGLDLDLDPTHPDKAGGLGFLGASVNAFLPLAVAHGVFLTGVMADHIFFDGARLADFLVEIAVLVVFLVMVFAGPLTVFALRLARVKRTGLGEYGALAQDYVRSFDSKWLRGGAPVDEPLIGSSDIQSLADLANSYAVIEAMRIVPVSRPTLIRFVAAILIPMAPLLLTIMPLEKLITSVVGIVSPL
jgi:hypothetical protein